MTRQAKPLLQLRAVSADYCLHGGWQSVLRNISLDIEAGESVGLVGESGSGKSTLASLALGERRSDRRIVAGSVLFDGIDLFGADRGTVQRLRGARLAFVPQNSGASLTPTMRVAKLFEETLRRHRPGLNRPATLGAIVTLLSDVGLTDPVAAMARYPHQFSGGQQQRIALALALSCGPNLLVLDEPTTGLDPVIRRAIIGLLKALCRQRGVAMLFVSHDLETVAELCSRVAVMYAGEIVEAGTTASIFSAPRHAYTQALIDALPRLDRPGRPASLAGEGAILRKVV
ncbi:ABC transporter ATP-binding protein [Labrys okinawensis]|uniref:ABC transporter ATP-binding protein n=1 Tax=Labrys okinawensis TaxID=346911 RepID=UPI0039BD903C